MTLNDLKVVKNDWKKLPCFVNLNPWHTLYNCCLKVAGGGAVSSTYLFTKDRFILTICALSTLVCDIEEQALFFCKQVKFFKSIQ